jgi:GT2 family glycosyltransferase
MTGQPRFVAGVPGPPDTAYDADIIILALDRPAETIAAIRSALGQTGVSRHVIVVDQGSAPASLAQLTEAVRDRTDVTLVALGHNAGVPGGRNIGTALGHGRIICGLDNDAVFDGPDVLARMVAAFGADSGLGAIGCRIVTDAGRGDDWSSWGYPASRRPGAGACWDSATFVGAGHAIRRDTWNDAGGYDDRLFFCWEEYDFCLRAIARFWRIRYRGDLVIRHKVSPERRVTWSGARWHHFVRNRIYIERKWGRSWMSLLPRIVGYAVKAARNGCLRGTPRALWAGFRMAKGITPEVMPPAARDYLDRVDRSTRGTLATRFRVEVLSPLPGTAKRLA